MLHTTNSENISLVKCASLVALCLVALFSYSSETKSMNQYSSGYEKQFAGSISDSILVKDLFRHFASNFNYIKSAKDKNMQGLLVATFRVSESGSLQEIKIVSGLDPELDREVSRVLALYKNTQASPNGQYLFPISLIIDGLPAKSANNATIPTIEGFSTLKKITIYGYY